MSLSTYTTPLSSDITLTSVWTDDGFKLESNIDATDCEQGTREYEMLHIINDKLKEAFETTVGMFDIATIPEKQRNEFVLWAAYSSAETVFRSIHECENRPYLLCFTCKNPIDITEAEVFKETEPIEEKEIFYSGLRKAATEMYEGLDLHPFSFITVTPVITNIGLELQSDIEVSVLHAWEHERISAANDIMLGIFKSIVANFDLKTIRTEQRRGFARWAACVSAETGFKSIVMSKDFPHGLRFTFKDAVDKTESELFKDAEAIGEKKVTFNGLMNVANEVRQQNGLDVKWPL